MEPTKDASPKKTLDLACIGILLENATPQEVNSASQDLIAFRSVTSGTHMVVLTNYPDEFLQLGRVVDFQTMRCPDMSRASVSKYNEEQKVFLRMFLIWKVYYVNQCPAVPPCAKYFYKRRVLIPGASSTKLRKDRPGYPVLERPSTISRDLPPGQSPNINRLPPQHTLNNWVFNPFFL